MKTRTEVDSLGTVKVPADVLYGAQTARAIENYPISGFRAHPIFIRSYALLKLACAEVNLNLGLIPRAVGRAIIQAAKDIARGLYYDQFVVDVYQAGAGVSFHMNVNEVIANLAIRHLADHRRPKPRLGDRSIVHPNDHVNFGQSTNDTFPTPARLAALTLLDEFYPAMDGLATALNPILGYDRAALVVKKAFASGETIPAVCVEENLLNREALDRLLDPRRMTEPGTNWIRRNTRQK